MEAQAINGKYDLFETVQETLRLEGRTFERGFLLGHSIEALHLEGTRFAQFQSLDVTYRNLRAVKTVFERCDFACTNFVGGYFRNVDFTDCVFRAVSFVDCVFDQCRLGVRDGATFERCLFFEAEALKVPLLAVATATPVASTPKAMPAPTPADPMAELAGRFSSLER